jgi:HSP20 family molecular chaperone IbpA
MASPVSTPKDSQPPTKRLKRAYSESSDDAPPLERRPKKRDDAVKFENTPPPSPPAAHPSIEMSEDEDMVPRTIDMEGINDEIVEAVIIQLQSTGNRPHLVKELATVLMQQLKIVQQ